MNRLLHNCLSFVSVIVIAVTINGERVVDMHRKGCGETKGCLFKPAGCNPQLDCTIGMIFYVSGPNMLTIQLVAQSLLPTPHYQYVAIGFSKDDFMGDDYVSECVLSPGGSTFSDVEVFASYNQGKSNDRTNLNSTEHGILFSDVQGEVVDGRLMCQFTQQIVPQMGSKNGAIWNLNQKLYIIGATGSAQPDEINVHDTTAGSHFYPITTARPINPSLVGPKIYDLPLPYKEKIVRSKTNPDYNRINMSLPSDKKENTENSSGSFKSSLFLLFFTEILVFFHILS